MIMRNLKIKVCGMREPGNISGIVEAGPDFLGFIFYSKSSRYVGLEPSLEVISQIPSSIKKVGVFVDETPGKVIENCRNYHLDIAQLHGNETAEYCRQIQESGFPVFKAFSINESFDFRTLEAYTENCNRFLFDTKGQLPGGTGHKFDWQLLTNYQLDVPFFLSGGIKPGDLNSIKEFQHPRLFGVDINSGFEISPALKDVNKVQQFIVGIKSII